MGGAGSRVGEDETAVGNRDALYNAIIVGMWSDTSTDPTNLFRLNQNIRPTAHDHPQ
jgi:hypothetical protein